MVVLPYLDRTFDRLLNWSMAVALYSWGFLFAIPR
jgi:hypothetical protein